MKFGPNKHSNFNVTIEDITLIPQETIKYLGFNVDMNFDWHSEIDKVSNKLYTVCFLLTQLSFICAKEILINVYYGLFYSVLTYSIQF